MEEGKAAAYYEELTRKGEGAARFKQGLGFSSNSPNSDSSFPRKITANSSSSPSSLFSNFVRASSPSKLQKQAQLESIHSKLTKKPPSPPRSDRHRRSRDRDDGRRSPRRERRGSSTRHRHRSREREEEEEYRRERHRKERRHRSRSRSSSREDRERGRGRGDRLRERDGDFYRRSSGIRRSRSPSSHGDRERREKKGSPRQKSSTSKSRGAVDYSQLIEGYAQMEPAERVKAKMKLQLSETAAKDTAMGMGSGWERFDFNKDAPLDDDDDEVEAADDDASIVKDIGKSFRYSAVEARREEEVKAAHDEAMFGVSKASTIVKKESIEENKTKDNSEDHLSGALISDKVLSMQQGSWRDRASKFRNNVLN